MPAYRLSPAAQSDLVAIRDYYLDKAGFRVARQMLVEFVEAFRRLAKTPHLGHKREDLAEQRPVLFWPMREYLIVYRISARGVEIVMIAHAHRDIARVIERREL